MWNWFLRLIGRRLAKHTNLTITFNGGGSVTIDKVTNWEVKHNGGPITSLLVEQKPSAKNRLVVSAVNLSTVVAIVTH